MPRWVTLAVAIAACTTGCTSIISTNVPCPPMQDATRAEIEEMCGPEMERCPALEWWLADLDNACRVHDLKR